MTQLTQATQLLLFLESKGISDKEIIERLGTTKSTFDRWWNGTKPNARTIVKLLHWVAEYEPITETYVGRRPPEYLFKEALEEAEYSRDDEYKKKHLIGYFMRCMNYPTYYDRGIPPSRTRRVRWPRSYFGDKRPTTDQAIKIIAENHPLPHIRETFSILSNERNSSSEEV